MSIILFLLLNILSKEELLKNSNFLYSKKLENVAYKINNYIEKSENKIVPRDFLLDELHKNGIYSYKILPFTYPINEKNISDKIKIELFSNKEEFNQIGISKSQNFLTLLLINNRLNISVDGKIKRFNKIMIKGKTLDNRLRILYLYIKKPNYQIKQLMIPIIENRFSIKYKLRLNGKYIFEFIDQSKNDPKIVAKFPIIIGEKIEKNSCNIKNRRDLLYEINKIRKINGLRALFLDEKLSKVSQKYSENMAKNGFFSHNSLNNLTPYQRVLKNNIKFSKILENISKGSNLCMSYKEIIDSPGHLKNILDKDINKIGIGIYKYNNTVFLTQNFIKSKKERLTLDKIKIKLKKSIKKRNHFMINDNYLDKIAYKKNSNEYFKIKNRKNYKVTVDHYSKIETYFFIIKSFQDIVSIIDNIKKYDYFGIDVNKYDVNNKNLIFISIILGKK